MNGRRVSAADTQQLQHVDATAATARSPTSAASVKLQPAYSLPPDLTLSDILDHLQTNHQRNTSIDHQLQSLVVQRSSLQQLLHTHLNRLPTQLNNITQQSNSLLSTITTANNSAGLLSGKVRELDNAQTRVKKALDRVSLVLELRDTIAEVENCLQKNDTHHAAELTYKALHLQQPLETDVSYTLLKSLESQLADRLTDELDEAIRTNNQAQQLTVAQLLPLVGLAYRGLQQYCSVVRQQLLDTLQKNALTIDSQPPGAVIQYLDLIAQQFDCVAQVLRQHITRVQQRFGSGSQLRLVQVLQQEVDVQAGQSIKRFMIDRKVNSTIAQIKQIQTQRQQLARQQRHNRHTSTNVSAVDSPSAKELELDAQQLNSILEEVAYVCRETEVFDTNIRKLAQIARNQLTAAVDAERDEQQSTVDGASNRDARLKRSKVVGGAAQLLQHLSADNLGAEFVHVSALNESEQELVGAYILMEEQYMLQNVTKAIAIDSHDGDEADAALRGLADGTAKRPGLQTATQDEDDAANPLRPSVSRDQLRGLAAVASGMAGVAAGTIGQALAAQGSTALSQQLGAQQNTLAQLLTTGVGLGTQANTAITATSASSNTTVGNVTVAQVFLKRFGTSLVSTVVDDVFFILKRCTERAFATLSAQSASAVVNHINGLLGREYRQLFDQAFGEYERRYGSAINNAGQGSASALAANILALSSAATSIGTAIAQKHQYDAQLLIAVNNLDTSIQHIVTLKNHLQHEFETQFAAGKSSKTPTNKATSPRAELLDPAAQLLTSCLDELSETASQFRATARRGIQLVAAVLQARLRTTIDQFLAQSYELTEQSYAASDAKDSPLQPVIDTFSREVLPLKKCLTEGVYTAIALQLVTYITNRLEQSVWKKSYTFWGAMQLDKDIRRVSNYFYALNLQLQLSVLHVTPSSSDSRAATPTGDRGSGSISTTTSVRDMFIRLIQLCTLLQLDQVNELYDYWADNAPEHWRLSANEVKRCLALRTEFSQKDINALKL